MKKLGVVAMILILAVQVTLDGTVDDIFDSLLIKL